MRGAWAWIRRSVILFGRGLREWCGDAAYEKYANCVSRQQSNELLSPTEFYVEQLNRKYSRPNRCC
jgi:uncharacterized short protein YbdD (DUF466 family)